MSYCINPECHDRQNLDGATKCHYCGTSLLINNEDRPHKTTTNYIYRIINHLTTNPNTCTQIFEVEQLAPNDTQRIKILKTIHDDDRMINSGEKFFTVLTKLFEREQRFLCFRNHPGIPKGYDFFSFPLSSGKKLHCLVMEKIEGVNLEEWVINNGVLAEADALDWLTQIVNILKFIHEKNFFHRDIKPSNIMWRQSDQNLVLIDFGAVRDISGTVIHQSGTQMTTKIGTPGYVAPEQFAGNAQPESDFYSLGRTFVYLLTGEHPRDIEVSSGISKWYEKVPYPISQSLIQLINHLMENDISKRLKDTQTILEEVNRIKNEIGNSSSTPINLPQLHNLFSTPTNRPQQRVMSSSPNITSQLGNGKNRNLLIKSGAIAFGLLGILFFIQLFSGEATQTENQENTNDRELISEICSSFEREDNISCGEESLISLRGNIQDPPQEKAKGMLQIQRGNYAEAQKLLEKAWEITRDGIKIQPDPETRIYLNNAKILNLIERGEITAQQVRAIAVAAPLKYLEGTDISNQALEMLRGIAQGQEQAIEDKLYLLVAIANDGNDKERASDIAEQLGTNKRILAAIGHYSSSIVKAALPNYQKNKLPLVSPASTSVELTGQRYLYRIAPSDAAAGKKIADYLTVQANHRKVAIFWTRGETFSESVKGEIEKQNSLSNDQILNTSIGRWEEEIFNLGSDTFNPEAALLEAKEQGVTSIVLIPDGLANTALENAYDVILANKDPNLTIIGADTLYTNRTTKEVGKNPIANKILVTVPWHWQDNKNDKFSKGTDDLWGTKQVSWLTATAYDATLVLAEAIRQNPSRKGVNDVLSDDKFIFSQGATGEIRFNISERDDLLTTLAKIIPKCRETSEYSFVGENYNRDCF